MSFYLTSTSGARCGDGCVPICVFLKDYWGVYHSEIKHLKKT